MGVAPLLPSVQLTRKVMPDQFGSHGLRLQSARVWPRVSLPDGLVSDRVHPGNGIYELLLGQLVNAIWCQ